MRLMLAFPALLALTACESLPPEGGAARSADDDPFYSRAWVVGSDAGALVCQGTYPSALVCRPMAPIAIPCVDTGESLDCGPPVPVQDRPLGDAGPPRQMEGPLGRIGEGPLRGI